MWLALQSSQSVAAQLAARYPGCIIMSARNAADVARLRDAIRGFFRQGQVEAELFLAWDAQQHRGKLFASCEVLEERADEAGAHFRVRGAPEVIAGLQGQFGPPPQALAPAEEAPARKKPAARKPAANKPAAKKSVTGKRAAK